MPVMTPDADDLATIEDTHAWCFRCLPKKAEKILRRRKACIASKEHRPGTRTYAHQCTMSSPVENLKRCIVCFTLVKEV